VSINSPEQHQIRNYLLGRLDDHGEEQVERRLLSDDEWFEEFELIESELLDQYVYGRLSDEERVLFEEHLLQTPKQREKLAFAMALKEEATDHLARTNRVVPLEPRSKLRFLSPTTLKIAAMVVVAVGLSVTAWFFLRPRTSDVERGMLALNQAYKNERLVESRISDVNYSQFRSRRGGQDSTIDTRALNEAQLRLLEAARTTGSAASYHALGRFYLAGKDFDNAKQQFERAIRLDSQNAGLQSDYAAALFELGKAARNDDKGKATEYFTKSLDHINRALELNGALLEALFNRGLVLEELMGLPEAEDAWRTYQQKDSTSPWAEEARRHLRAIQDQRK
jgi:tetratricopeptide (TPR) repeat protein